MEKEKIARELLRLKKAYPNTLDFYEILMDRIIRHNIRASELRKIIDDVLDTERVLTVASVIKRKGGNDDSGSRLHIALQS